MSAQAFQPGSRSRTTPQTRVREVETVACPERDGNHWLINRRGVTLCRGCDVEWWRLDAGLRGAS